MGHAAGAEGWRLPVLGWLAMGAAWLVAGVAELTGGSVLLHHHTLIDGSSSVGSSLVLFAAGWLAMIAAMMLPVSIGTISAYGAVAAHRPSGSASAFVGAFFLVWLVVGFAFLVGDVAIHWLVDSTPSIAERAWLIEVGLFAFAGAYQFLPLKRRFLEACRAPAMAAHDDGSGFAAGVAHALDCVGSSGPMMLLMFGVGVGNLWWMFGLTGVMAYEARGRHGRRAASAVGVVLIVLALLGLTDAGLPA